jgi:acyl transferase domain-containing protein
LDDFLAGRAGGWEAGKVLRRNQRPKQEEVSPALAARDITALGQLWLKGARVDFQRLYTEQSRRRVALPGHPFERKRYWPDPGELPKQAPAAAGEPAPQFRQGREPSLIPIDANQLRPLPTEPVRPHPREPEANLTVVDAEQLKGGLVRVDIQAFRGQAAEPPLKN